MANQKVSAMPAVSSFFGTEQFPLVTGGANYSVTWDEIVANVFAWGSAHQTGPLYINVNNTIGGDVSVNNTGFGVGIIDLVGGASINFNGSGGVGIGSGAGSMALIDINPDGSAFIGSQAGGAAVVPNVTALNLVTGGTLNIDGNDAVTGTFSPVTSITLTNGIVTAIS